MTRDEIKSLLIDHGIYHPSGALLDRLASAGASVVPKESTAPDEVSVTQADRDAAAEVGLYLYSTAKRSAMQEGSMDDHPLVQAFARHRTASEQSRVGEGAERECGICHAGVAASNDLMACHCQEVPWFVRTSQPTPAEGLATQCSGDADRIVDCLCASLRGTDEAADQWTFAGMQDAFFRWPVVERELRRVLSALRTTHSPSEAGVEAFRRVIHDECRNHAEATVVAGSFSQGYATAWEDAARILPDRLAALSRPSDKTVELLREARSALRKLAGNAGALGAFEDEIRAPAGNTNWQCLRDAITQADATLVKLDSHLGEMK